MSVLICTRDRAESLRKVLEALAASEPVPDRSWEVVVVDNGSVDHTKDVVTRAADDFPVPVRYAREPRFGKSRALNTGIAIATGDIIAFTDDDVEVPPNWVSAICAPFADPDCSGVVGRVLPRFTDGIPDWLPVRSPWNLTASLLTLDLGEEVMPSPVPPFGANMAYRRSLLDSVGPFDTGLGPGSALRLGEDTEYWSRVRGTGANVLYVPAAIIWHPLGPERVNRHSLLAWHREAGCANAEFFRPPAETRRWFGVPRYLYRELIGHLLQSFLQRPRSRRFYHRTHVEHLWGLMKQLRSQAGRVRSSPEIERSAATTGTHGSPRPGRAESTPGDR